MAQILLQLGEAADRHTNAQRCKAEVKTSPVKQQLDDPSAVSNVVIVHSDSDLALSQ